MATERARTRNREPATGRTSISQSRKRVLVQTSTPREATHAQETLPKYIWNTQLVSKEGISARVASFVPSRREWAARENVHIIFFSIERWRKGKEGGPHTGEPGY